MGEMSKIEEVARAMIAELNKRAGWGYIGDDDDLTDVVVDDRVDLIALSKAAIEVMRNANLIYAVLEPRTEADEIAGRREFYGDSGAWLSLWNSAIDAALKE